MDIAAYFASLGKPKCAVNINGEYLEDTITGYRTSAVSGRDTLSMDISEMEIGRQDGAKYRNKKDKTRDIDVVFNLTVNTVEEYHELSNKMKVALYQENSRFIFLDESEVYYIGTISDVAFVKMDTRASEVLNYQGQYTIHCNDPYKYSVKEYTITPTLDENSTFLVDYRGTRKSFPTFEATMTSDNGYVAFVDEDEHILQFGNPTEADGEDYKENETLLDLSNFIESPDDTTGIEAMHPSYDLSGSLKVSNWFGANFLSLGTPGTKSSTLHGGMRTVNVPADSSGKVGAKNWYSYFHVLFYAGLMGQTGEMSISFCTEDNKCIAGVNWCKTDANGNSGYYEFWSMGKVLRKMDYTTSHLSSQNPWYWNWGHSDLRKEGSKLTFYWWGSYPEFTIPAIENLECTKIQISIKQFTGRGGSKYLTYNGIDIFKFQKMNVDKWKDVPNKFSNGNVLTVDCQNGEVTNNGLPAQSLGAIGNNWEELYLKPGVNQIKCLNSDWASQKPDFKLKYREVFL